METSDILATVALLVAIASAVYSAWTAHSFRAQDDLQTVRHVAVSSLSKFYRGLSGHPDGDSAAKSKVGAEIGQSYATARDAYRIYRHRFSGADQRVLDRLIDSAEKHASDFESTKSEESGDYMVNGIKEFLEMLDAVLMR